MLSNRIYLEKMCVDYRYSLENSTDNLLAHKMHVMMLATPGLVHAHIRMF